MAAPTYRGVGTNASGTTSASFPEPASCADGDLMLIVVESSDSTTAAGTPNTPSNWTSIFERTEGADATGVTTLTVFARIRSGDATVTVDGVLNHLCGRMTAVETGTHGVNNVATDIDVGAGTGHGTDITDLVTGELSGLAADSLIFWLMGLSDDANDTTNVSGQTNANFASITERWDQTVNTGAGGGTSGTTATCAGTTTGAAGNWDHDTAIQSQSVYIAVPPVVTVFASTARSYRWYADGTETGSTALQAENTAHRVVASADAPLQLRYGVQESGAGSVAGVSTDDYQLQVSKNGGAFADVAGASSNVKAFPSASLTDAAVTTTRLAAGSGSFVAGEIDEADGLITDWQLTADNYSDLLYSIQVVAADVAHNDVLTFRVLRNGAVLDVYSFTPTVSVSKPSTTAWTFHDLSAVPVHAGSNALTQVTVPVNTDIPFMETGDLVVVTQVNKTVADLPFSVGVDGGQTWNDLGTDTASTNRASNVWWAVFDGTWDAEPRFDVVAVTQSHSVIMYVFRPPTGYTTALDVEGTAESDVAPSTPFDVTLTGITTLSPITVTMAHILSPSDTTYVVQTGGWVGATYDNLAGTDQGVGVAYKLATSEGATGNVVFRQTLGAGDVWLGKLASWKATSGSKVMMVLGD